MTRYILFFAVLISLLIFSLSFTNVAAQLRELRDLSNRPLPLTGIQLPQSLEDFLLNFGFTTNFLSAEGWGGVLYFIIIPLLTFAIVLKAILIDEIITGMMGFSQFQDWKGWAFVLLILGFLVPTGILGMAAMWLYASAGIFVVYGFGALLILSVARRFFITNFGVAVAAGVTILIVVIISFIFPQIAIIVAPLGIGWAVLGYIRSRGITARSEAHTLIGEANIMRANFNTWFNTHVRGKYGSKVETDIISEWDRLLEDFGLGSMNRAKVSENFRAYISVVNSTLPTGTPRIPTPSNF